jgi:hypothetical protein
MKKHLALIAALTTLFCSALEIKISNGTVSVYGDGMNFTVKDGVITSVSGLEFSAAPNQPAGLGILRNVDLLRAGHMPWGEPALNQTLKSNFDYSNYFRPCSRSKIQFKKTEDSLRIIWKGLSNNKEFLPDAVYSMEFSQRKDGAMQVSASGSCKKGGVFGAVVPFGTIKSRNIVTPTLGGMKYFTEKPAILTFGTPPYLEAPFCAVETGKGKSFGIWLEDPTFRPTFLAVARTENGFAPTMEINTLMPYEDKTSVTTPPVMFKVFNGDWKVAATPFRNFYRNTFAKEIAVRDGVKWADKITILSGVEYKLPDDSGFEKYVSLYGKDKVLMMTWNARADGWDMNLPIWRPRKGYVEGVARAHKHNLRTMAYVNICCANYYSEGWKKYNMDKVFLTRKNSIYQYKNAENQTGAKALNIGNNDYGAAPDLMKSITKGSILYGDLLSHLWREFHVDLMKEWYAETKTDANYEDTAGTTGDHGNGTIRGLSAGQGDAEQMRLLLQGQPHVPNAGEFAPAAVAFGIKWPLNYPAVYGNHAFRVSRLHRQVPLSNYLYGYRQLLTENRGYSDFLKFLQGAVGDMVGGFGFIESGFIINNSLEEIEKSKTYNGFLHRRAKIFSDKNLKNYYPEGSYPENICAMYKGDDGIYSLYDNGYLQEMRSPSSKALYGRVNGANKAKTSLAPANWPFFNGKEISGLNPDEFYCLFSDIDKTALYADSLPDDVYLETYFDTPSATFLKLNSKKVTETEFLLNSRGEYDYCMVNGEKWTPGTAVKGKLPLSVICFKKGNNNAYAVSKVSPGQMIGDVREYSALPDKQLKKRVMKELEGGDALLAVPVAVTGENMIFEAIVRDDSNLFIHPHDGTLLLLSVNGKQLKELDSTSGVEPKWITDKEARALMFDQRLRKWTIPLGKMFKKGEKVLVNIECFSRGNTRGDKVLLTYSTKEGK